jgi:hypothetical protein
MSISLSTLVGGLMDWSGPYVVAGAGESVTHR